MSLHLETWALREPFVIAGSTSHEIVTLTVVLHDAGVRGWGEAIGVDYLGETAESLRAQLESCRATVERGALASAAPAPGGGAASAPDPAAISDPPLSRLLPPGGARNALDCALWDLRLKSAGRSIWSWLGIAPRPVTTALTLSLGSPDAMAAAARSAAAYPVLKLKLDADDPAARIAAVREARPDAALLVDANRSWSVALLAALTAPLVEHRVSLVEQPLPIGGDAELADWDAPVALCADESCQSEADLDQVATRYQAINVKLDKCGGLSAALRLVARAREQGLELMVGNMLGSSLAMAPAFVVAQQCRWVDLDGPLLQRADRVPALRYAGAVLHPPSPELWG